MRGMAELFAVSAAMLTIALVIYRFLTPAGRQHLIDALKRRKERTGNRGQGDDD